MASIRFKHGIAMALVLIGLFAIVAAVGELARAADGIRTTGAILALGLGAGGLLVGAAYLWRTLDEGELPDKAKERMAEQLDAEE